MRRARLLLGAALILSAWGAPAASAQTIRILFKDAKTEKNYAKYLTQSDGVTCVIGEIKKGIHFDGGTLVYVKGTEALNEIWVINPADPGELPYEIDKNGERVKNRKAKVAGVLAIPGDSISATHALDRYRTLEGTAADYRKQQDEIAAIAKERDAAPKAGRAWFDAQGRMLGRMDRLASFIKSLGYTPTAKLLEKEIEKQRKVVGKQAAAEREKQALASVKTVPLPPKFVAANQTITGGKVKFTMQESRHVRVVYDSDVQDARVTAALELCERIIEGFQREFVDPYADETFPNLIPDGPMHEFYFGPDDVKVHEQFLTLYYEHPWGKYKADELKAEGADYYLPADPHYLSYRKVVPEIDVEGYLAHEVGHTLADLHYNEGARNDRQDWLREAVGYWVSFAYLGRNGLTCFATAEEGGYEKTAQKVGIKTPTGGMRDVFNQIALKAGPPIDTLALKHLWEINDADFAKAWSFFDFVAAKLGRQGQLWLRATCKTAAAHEKDFVQAWRKATEPFYPAQDGGDVFANLDAQWKQYATTGQVAGTR